MNTNSNTNTVQIVQPETDGVVVTAGNGTAYRDFSSEGSFIQTEKIVLVRAGYSPQELTHIANPDPMTDLSLKLVLDDFIVSYDPSNGAVSYDFRALDDAMARLSQADGFAALEILVDSASINGDAVDGTEAFAQVKAALASHILPGTDMPLSELPNVVILPDNDEPEGLNISAVNTWSALGQELALQSGDTAYLVYDRNDPVEMDGSEIIPTYHVLQNNQLEKGADSSLGGSALETALKFGSIYQGVAEFAGTDQDDRFFSRNDDVAFSGGAGDDLFRTSGGRTTMDGGAGDDTFQIWSGKGTFVDGGDGDGDTAYGLDTETGLVIGSINQWSMLGNELGIERGSNAYNIRLTGATADFNGTTVSANYFSLNENIAARGSTDQLSATALETSLALSNVVINVETIVGSNHDDRFFGGSADDHFVGKDGDDWFNTGAGDDRIDAGDGSDTIVIGAGNDVVDGGDGDDTLRLNNNLSTYTFTRLEDGRVSVLHEAGETLLTSVEQVRTADGNRVSIETLLDGGGQGQTNRAPEFAAATIAPLAENAEAGTVVGQVTASDPDGDTLTYAITAGNDQGIFAINSQSGEITVADAGKLDFETSSLHSLEITVTDGELANTATFDIPVEDVDDTWDPTVQALLEQTNRAFGLKASVITVNLSELADWNNQDPFLDIMKFSRPGVINNGTEWGKYSHQELVDGGYLDENGWPIEIPEDATHWSAFFSAEASRAGTFVLTYEGDGEIDFQNVTVISEDEDLNQIVFEYSGSGNFQVQIRETDPQGTGDYIRNVSIVRQEYVALHEAGQIFNPDFLAVIENFQEIRFMHWDNIIDTEVTSVEDMTPFGFQTWGGYGFKRDGVPKEVMAELANQTGVDLWINIPPGVDDAYIRELAQFYKDNLDPNLQITVEYGNELWNNSYDETHEIREWAQADWGVGPEAYEAFYMYTAKLATEAAIIWNEVFGEEAEARLHHTLGMHTVGDSRTKDLLEPTDWKLYEPDDYVDPLTVFDSLAVTNYFGGKTITFEDLRQDILDAIADPEVDAMAYFRDLLLTPDYPGSIQNSYNEMIEQRELADQYGLDLIMYEGGTHIQHYDGTDMTPEEAATLLDFMSDFAGSEYMAELYQVLLENWMEIGDGPLMQFGTVGEHSIYGVFSFLENLQDSNARADWLYQTSEEVDQWWDGAEGGEYHQQGVTEDGTEGDDVLIGTNQEDFLIGQAGNDILVGGAEDDGYNGGSGIDTVVLSGTLTDYIVYREDDGFKVAHKGGYGTDYLVNVEQLQFEDGSIALLEDLLGSEDANSPVQAQDDAITVREDIALNLGALLTGNDSDTDGDTLHIIDADDLYSSGHVLVNPDGTVTYTPGKDFVGEDTFTYTVTDGTARSEGTVTVTVINEPDAPVVEPEQVYSVLDTAEVGSTLLTVEASDLDGDTLTYSITAGNDEGRFDIDPATGEIKVAKSLLKEGPLESYALNITVSDGQLTTEAVYNLDVHGQADSFDLATVSGSLVNGLEGTQDTVYLISTNGEGFRVGTIGYWGETGEEMRLGNIVDDVNPVPAYTVYQASHTVEIDGLDYKASSSILNNNVLASGDTETISDSALGTALMFANVIANVEVVVGSDYADRFFGNDTNETRYGGAGNDYMSMAGGDDLLVGGLGRDTLFGGAGSDTFVFDNLDTFDVVRDFNPDEGDVLSLSSLLGNFDPETNALVNLVSLTENDGTYDLSIRLNGDGDYTKVAQLNNITDELNLEDLINNGNISINDIF